MTGSLPRLFSRLRRRPARVEVVEHYPHLYQPEALQILIDGKPLRAIRWSRLRDGGTTRVETERGLLYRPAPRRTDVPTLDGKEIELSWEIDRDVER